MSLAVLLILSLACHSVHANSGSSFDLTLRVHGIDSHFRFVETTTSSEARQGPSIVVLDDGEESTLVQPPSSTLVRTYRTENDESLLNMATMVDRSSTGDHLLFATVQTLSGTYYDIFPAISKTTVRRKRSSSDDYIVRDQQSMIEDASVAIEWHQDRRYRRDTEGEESVTAIVDSEKIGRASCRERVLNLV